MKPCVEKRRHSTVYKEHTYSVHNVATTTRVSKRMVLTYDVHSKQSGVLRLVSYGELYRTLWSWALIKLADSVGSL